MGNSKFIQIKLSVLVYNNLGLPQTHKILYFIVSIRTIFRSNEYSTRIQKSSKVDLRLFEKDSKKRKCFIKYQFILYYFIYIPFDSFTNSKQALKQF